MEVVSLKIEFVKGWGSVIKPFAYVLRALNQSLSA